MQAPADRGGTGDLTLFRRLTGATIVATFILIVIGGIVRVSDSGLGCGPAGSGTDGWPLCGGRLLPFLDTNAIIEFSHRAVAGVVAGLILALAFVAALGPGIENAVLAIALTTWSPYARISRAEALTIRNSEFILAARTQGASSFRILRSHVVPLCLSSVIVRLTLDMAGLILTAAGLGFLGLGAQPPSPEWGAMISTGRQYILDQWWVPTIPGLAILIVSLGFNLLGDGLRDVLDPKGGG